MVKTNMVRLPSAVWARAIRDSTPPSPRLSARMRNRTYLMVTTRIRAHRAKDTTPSTPGRLAPSFSASSMAALKA